MSEKKEMEKPVEGENNGENNEESNAKEVNFDKLFMQKVEVTMGDLQIMSNIIEAVTSRGAFRASELKGVGEFFEKISGMIPKDNNPSSTTPQ